MRAVGRLFVTLVGFIVAIAVAALFLVVASTGLHPAPADATVRWWFEFTLALGYATSLIGAAAFVPMAVLIIVSESLAIRAIVAYIAFGAALGGAAALGLSSRFSPAGQDATGATLLVATGIVGGCVYWLIAGRTAGLTARVPSSPRETPPT